MNFATGDRVRMIQHADWKVDAIGTITSSHPVQRILPDSSIEWEYWIKFDSPQNDLTDELSGEKERYYKSTTVLERYLVALDDENAKKDSEKRN